MLVAQNKIGVNSARLSSNWTSHELSEGSDEWMDAIGTALDDSKMQLIILSPEALDSKFIRMEYRAFLNHNKLIVPVLHRSVKRMLPELSHIQMVDFSANDFDHSFSTLKQIIDMALET